MYNFFQKKSTVFSDLTGKDQGLHRKFSRACKFYGINISHPDIPCYRCFGIDEIFGISKHKAIPNSFAQNLIDSSLSLFGKTKTFFFCHRKEAGAAVFLFFFGDFAIHFSGKCPLSGRKGKNMGMQKTGIPNKRYAIFKIRLSLPGEAANKVCGKSRIGKIAVNGIDGFFFLCSCVSALHL